MNYRRTKDGRSRIRDFETLSQRPIRLAHFLKIFAVHKGLICAALYLSFVAQLSWASSPQTRTEEKFASLQVGANTYLDVTVTTKATNYIYIMHSTGMTSIKVSQLPADIREKLGYAPPPAPKWQPTAARAWARQAATKIDRPEIKQMQEELRQVWNKAQLQLPPITPAIMIGAAAGLLVTYLFFCYCCGLICRKCGKEPGLLVWLPLLKLVPMLRAASMSPWWLILFFVPVLNLVAYIAWSFKIVKARGKTMPLAILLLLPVTNVLAFLYLAFSDAAPEKSQGQRLELIGLQTA
jgi:hypothetical protein